MSPEITVLGVISDTHGLIRPSALRMLEGSALILHAGDIGSPDVLYALRAIAPVIAVRGNTDTGSWAGVLPKTEFAEINGMRFCIVHDLSDLDIDPAAAGVRAVISGHSHRPAFSESGGILHLNPGSAGPRRFNLPVTLACITMRHGRLDPEIVNL
jgi:putative phosphoesterase